MEITTASVARLADACQSRAGDELGILRPIGYAASLALCIIDAIYATGSQPRAVDNIIDRYVARHGYRDGAKSLRYSIAAAGGERAWAVNVAENLKPAHTRPGAPLKAEIVNRATRLMADLDIETVPDLLAAVSDDPLENAVRDGWTSLPSQSSGVTYFHLLTLAGADHFEADRVVRRFLARVSADPRDRGGFRTFADEDESWVPPEFGRSAAPWDHSFHTAEDPVVDPYGPIVADEWDEPGNALPGVATGTGDVFGIGWAGLDPMKDPNIIPEDRDPEPTEVDEAPAWPGWWYSSTVRFGADRSWVGVPLAEAHALTTAAAEVLGTDVRTIERTVWQSAHRRIVLKSGGRTGPKALRAAGVV